MSLRQLEPNLAFKLTAIRSHAKLLNLGAGQLIPVSLCSADTKLLIGRRRSLLRLSR